MGVEVWLGVGYVFGACESGIWVFGMESACLDEAVQRLMVAHT